jgi:exodeoxyribonuclease-3
MTYNIYNGATTTFDEVIDIVRYANPDVLVLNEANGFEYQDKLKQFAEKTNFPYYEIGLCGDGDDYHVALLSKLPFASVEHIEPLSRAAILALIHSPSLGDIAVVGTHLSPYSEVVRLNEVKLILSAMESYDNKVVMGDMNSLANSDHYPPNLIQDFNTGQLRKFTTDGKIQFDVIQDILDSGLTDTAVLLGKNHDTTAPTSVNTDAEHSDMRLDYIFISKCMTDKLAQYYVVKNPTTEIASDHYPVCIEIN